MATMMATAVDPAAAAAPAQESAVAVAAAASSSRMRSYHPLLAAASSVGDITPHCLEPSSELPVEPCVTTTAQIEAFKRKVSNNGKDVY